MLLNATDYYYCVWGRGVHADEVRGQLWGANSLLPLWDPRSNMSCPVFLVSGLSHHAVPHVLLKVPFMHLHSPSPQAVSSHCQSVHLTQRDLHVYPPTERAFSYGFEVHSCTNTSSFTPVIFYKVDMPQFVDLPRDMKVVFMENIATVSTYGT